MRRALRRKRRVAGRRRWARPGRVLAVNRRDYHKFKRNFNFGTLAQAGAVGGIATGGWFFSLNNLPNVSEFTNLFDNYQITYIKLYVYLKLTPDAATAATAAYPIMHVRRDHDDSAAPPDIYEYSNIQRRQLSPNRPFILKLKPAVRGEIASSGVTTFTPRWRVWLPTTNPEVPHYGMKFQIRNWLMAGADIDVTGTMYFNCKNQR